MKNDDRVTGVRSVPFVIDINREHTEAEVEVVQYCFGCSRSVARGILSARLTKERLAEVRGMLDAMCVERIPVETPVPDWLQRMKMK